MQFECLLGKDDNFLARVVWRGGEATKSQND